MPSLKRHLTIDSNVFRVPYGTFVWVHNMLDQPWARLFGKKHRKVLHSQETVNFIRLLYGEMPAMVAQLHILVDWCESIRYLSSSQLIKK